MDRKSFLTEALFCLATMLTSNWPAHRSRVTSGIGGRLSLTDRQNVLSVINIWNKRGFAPPYSCSGHLPL